ncbi:MAG: type 1 periplasmic-binding domain-containing protein [Candidatus Dormibacteria bacterium]
MGALALALMIAILPSSLHLPTTGPGSQAEVAPVPGQGKTQANLSQLGLADSGTVGGGGSSASGDAAPPTPAVEEILGGLALNHGVAQQSRCVGNPPRQTEDPLSPPCVPSWGGGSNGGATAKGVSANTITLVLVNDHYGHDGFVYNDPAQSNDDPVDSTARVLLRYFQSRFQTYGRTVRLVSQYSPSPSFADVDSKFHPFAVVPVGLGDDSYYPAAANARSMVFEGTFRREDDYCDPTATMRAHAPYMWCFNPSRESRISAFANYVCGGVVGKPAAISTDPTTQLKTRKFAIVDTQLSRAQPTIDALNRVCGLSPTFYADPEANTASGNAALPAQMKADGITTVIVSDAAVLMKDAATQQYTPEWLFNTGAISTQFRERNAASANSVATEWNSAFGISYNWRWKSRPSPYYYAAAQETSPGFQPDGYLGSSVYYGLLMAFTAIQVAGPNLTPANVEKGLQRFTAADDSPYSPHAGYAPGDYNFIKDYMIVRWDSTGNPPDGEAGSGCLRLADGGRRYSPQGPWPTDDRAAADGATQPCQADEIHASEGAADNNHN